MSFASPLFLLGLFAATLPVAIHLVGRQRAPRRRFAALDFVLSSNRRVARKHQLRQILLLVLRALLVGGIAVLLAKPFVEVESDLPAIGGRPQSAVLILDDTLSMRRQVKGDSLFSLAQARAQAVVTLLGAQTDIAVLRLARPSGPLPSLTRDTRKIRSAISQLKAGYRHAVWAPAVLAASRILADSFFPDRHIFVFSDMAAHGGPTDVGKLLEGVQLHAVDVAKDREPENHAVVELTAAPSDAPGLRSTKITTRVCNHGGKKVTLGISLTIDEKQAVHSLQSFEPWTCHSKSFQHTFAQGGLHYAVVSLDPDDLREDDQRYLILMLESPIRVLLINGSPSAIRHRDELFYLEAALEPNTVGGQPVVVKSITTHELGQVLFDPYDVVVLCNVATLPEKRRVDLEAFVSRGGGLLISMGDNVEPAAFNLALGDLLPQGLHGPISAIPEGGGETMLRIGRVDGGHPILGLIGSDSEQAGLRSARFSKVYRLSPSTQGERKIILWYDDGSPALVESRRGRGRILLFTSTLDRDWTDLPIRPVYLPLVQQIIRYLSRIPNQSLQHEVEVGTVETLPLEKTIKQLRLLRPTGTEKLWTAAKLAGRRAVEILVTAPGFYQVSGADARGVMRPLDRASFVANLNAKESDLRKGKAPSRGESRAGGRAKQRVELWHGFAAALLLLLLGEAFIIRRG